MEPLLDNMTQEYLQDFLNGKIGQETPSSSSSPSSLSSSHLSDQLIGVIVGAIVIPVIIVFAVIIFFVCCRWRIKKTTEKLSNEDDPKLTFNFKDEIPLTKMHQNNGHFTYNNSIFNNNNNIHNINNNNININNNMLRVNNYATSSSSSSTTSSTTLSTTMTLKKYGLTINSANQKPENGVVDPYSIRLLGQRELPQVPLVPFNDTDYHSDTNTSTYAVPEHYRIAPPPSISTTNKNRVNHVVDISLNRKTQNWVDASDDIINWVAPGVRELTRNQLRLVEKLGEGLFGEVHLCDLEYTTQFMTNQIRPKKTIGAVKILSNNASAKMRENFLQEIRVLSQLNDPNISSILGACCHSDDLTCFVVIEYTCHGIMTQFLKSKSMGECTSKSSKIRAWGRRSGPGSHKGRVKPLSYGSLIYMATQISSGMKYLEQSGIIHRDLATRNCLVGRHLSVKISDIGSYSDLYKNDYYGGQGQIPTPIRWMAWESVLLGEFTSKSDVWSFGVTLWEILTLATTRPFNELDDQQVIDNHALLMGQPEMVSLPNGSNKTLETIMARESGSLLLNSSHSNSSTVSCRIVLPQPPSCPREIYDMMETCWCRDGTSRPSFAEIHMFLSRKNMGYNPEDDCEDDDIVGVGFGEDNDDDSGFAGECATSEYASRYNSKHPPHNQRNFLLNSDITGKRNDDVCCNDVNYHDNDDDVIISDDNNDLKLNNVSM